MRSGNFADFPCKRHQSKHLLVTPEFLGSQRLRSVEVSLGGWAAKRLVRFQNRESAVWRLLGFDERARLLGFDKRLGLWEIIINGVGTVLVLAYIYSAVHNPHYLEILVRDLSWFFSTPFRIFLLILAAPFVLVFPFSGRHRSICCCCS